MIVKSARSHPQYPFDNAAPQAGERFASLAELYDGATCRHLRPVGDRPGLALSRGRRRRRIDSAIHE